MTRWAKTAICCGNMSEADTHLEELSLLIFPQDDSIAVLERT